MSRRAKLLLIAVALVAIVLAAGMNYTLLAYRGQAHAAYVHQMQNGIRGALTDLQMAQHWVEQGDMDAARHYLSMVPQEIDLVQYGATGMSIKTRGNPFDLMVLGLYKSTAYDLGNTLTKDTKLGEVQTHLADLVYDTQALQELFGSDEQSQWLMHANLKAVQERYNQWRTQARLQVQGR